MHTISIDVPEGYGHASSDTSISGCEPYQFRGETVCRGVSISDIVLSKRGQIDVADFALIPLETTYTHLITGTIFFDENNNGIFDDTEAVIPNVTVKIDDDYPTKTNYYGVYEFYRVPTGTFEISIDMPDEYTGISTKQVTLADGEDGVVDFA